MIVYHGTGSYSLDGIMTSGLDLHHRNYVKRKCACTTTDIAIAQLFATRKTSGDDFLAGRITGVVLEFNLRGSERIDFEHAKDCALQDEREIVIYTPSSLILVAVHQYDNGIWRRNEVQWQSRKTVRR
jgi:hypothetical protein